MSYTAGADCKVVFFAAKLRLIGTFAPPNWLIAVWLFELIHRLNAFDLGKSKKAKHQNPPDCVCTAQ